MRCKEQTGGSIPLYIGLGPYPACTKKKYNRERNEHLQSLRRVIKGKGIDIEMDDCCLRGFGTIAERKFYRKKYQETYNALKSSGALDNQGYPEWWETTGYTKGEFEQMRNDVIKVIRL